MTVKIRVGWMKNKILLIILILMFAFTSVASAGKRYYVKRSGEWIRVSTPIKKTRLQRTDRRINRNTKGLGGSERKFRAKDIKRFLTTDNKWK